MEMEEGGTLLGKKTPASKIPLSGSQDWILYSVEAAKKQPYKLHFCMTIQFFFTIYKYLIF